MARRKKSDTDIHADPAAVHEADEALAVATDQDDVFGQAIAEAQARHEQPSAAVSAPALNGAAYAGPQQDAPAQEHPRRRHSAMATDVAAKMKLFSNHQSYKMAITFDDGKPSEAVRDALKSCGFQWNRDEGAWEKPTSYATRIRDRLDAEDLFAAVAKMRLEENGISEGATR